MADSATRHLGFFIDLRDKVLRISDKHKSKILKFLCQFHAMIRKNERIPIKNIQKMLGL